MYRKIVLGAAILLSAGCSGLDCPLDPPNCCYDALFGCELFDLPMGCSCSDYGLGFASSAVLRSPQKKLASTPTARVSGDWTGSLTQLHSTCPNAPRRLSGILRVRERNGSVTVAVPGYGRLIGRSGGRRNFTAKGRYKVPLSSCSADVSTRFTSRRAALGNLSAEVTLTCGSLLSCGAAYSGTIQKR